MSFAIRVSSHDQSVKSQICCTVGAQDQLFILRRDAAATQTKSDKQALLAGRRDTSKSLYLTSKEPRLIA